MSLITINLSNLLDTKHLLFILSKVSMDFSSEVVLLKVIRVKKIKEK
jgi:hypothetical protein